jgi:hypothetical protein
MLGKDLSIRAKLQVALPAQVPVGIGIVHIFAASGQQHKEDASQTKSNTQTENRGEDPWIHR